MEAFDAEVRQRRGRKALALALMALAALSAGFLQLQVLGAVPRTGSADGRQVRAVPLAAPRGMIVDRHGAIMADDVAAYDVLLLPGPGVKAEESLDRLAKLLSLTPEDITELKAPLARDRHGPVVVASGLPYTMVQALGGEAGPIPGVWVEERPRRYYPAGTAAGHLLAAVEREHDGRLAGRDGFRLVEVDGIGTVRETRDRRRVVPARSGRTLQLTVDLELQRMVAMLVPETVRGAVVVLDGGSGEILALYSSPAVEPRTALAEARLPGNRALTGLYPPGRAWQLVTATTALRLGIIESDAPMPLPCRGGMPYGDRYHRCWDRRGHGALGLAAALGAGCDVYFYQLGLKIGAERILREGARFGFGRPTGMGLAGELAGQLPQPPRARAGAAAAEEAGLATLRLAALGEDVTASPLQLARFMAAVATGAGPMPVILSEPREPGERPLLLDLEPAAREILHDGLAAATTPDGYATIPAPGGWEWGASARRAPGERARPDLYLGVARAGEAGPVLVVAVALEDGRAESSARIAAEAVDFHLRRLR